MDLASLTLDDFTKCTGDEFHIALEGDKHVVLTLVSAENMKTSEAAETRELAFSVVFRGPPNHPLDQSIYDMEHADLGILGIFIVPISQDGTGIYYEAVFTRVS